METITTTLPCVDAKVTTNNQVLQLGRHYKGSFVQNSEDQVQFVEETKVHTIHPELHWRLLDRTKHGRVHINSRHVKVEFYIHHDDYQNGRELADILASEIETMGESLSEMCLAEEVEKCC